MTWCNSCTDAQKKQVAGAYPIGTIVFVGDTINRNYKGWYIDQGWTEEQPSRPYPKPTPATPDPSEEDMIEAMITFYNLSPVGWQKAGDLHYDGPNHSTLNVYDIVNGGPTQNNFLGWVKTNPYTIGQTVHNAVVGIGGMFKITIPQSPHIDLTIDFDDGSTVTVDIDVTHSNMVVTVRDNSGIDSHQNTVLTHAPPQGDNRIYEFDFSHPGNTNDYNDWLHQMGLLGYTIPVTPGVIWACTNSPGTGLHCVRQF